MGVLAALAGIIFAGRLNQAGPTAGNTFELDAIAAAFIGGAAVQGGVGKVVGAITGGLIMGVINNGMSLIGAPSERVMLVKGAGAAGRGRLRRVDQAPGGSAARSAPERPGALAGAGWMAHRSSQFGRVRHQARPASSPRDYGAPGGMAGGGSHVRAPVVAAAVRSGGGAGVGYLLVLARRRRDTVGFTALELLERVAPSAPGWSRHVPAAGILLALALLTVGLAGPTAEGRVPRNRATVVLVIDVSLIDAGRAMWRRAGWRRRRRPPRQFADDLTQWRVRPWVWWRSPVPRRCWSRRRRTGFRCKRAISRCGCRSRRRRVRRSSRRCSRSRRSRRGLRGRRRMGRRRHGSC